MSVRKMATVKNKNINNKVLIREIKKRSALYDKTLKDFSGANCKNKLWDEVYAKVFSTIWENLSTKQRKKARSLVHRRWNTLRTYFARELRKRKSVKSGQSAKKSQKFKYYKQLLFLRPFLQLPKTTVKAEPVVSNEEHEKIEGCSSLAPLPNDERGKCSEESLLDNQEKDETSSDSNNPDRHFVLSIIPMLKALPPLHKLDAQIHILQVIRNIHSCSARGKYTQFGCSNLQEKDETSSDSNNPDTHFVLPIIPMLKVLPPLHKLDAQIRILQVIRNIYSGLAQEQVQPFEHSNCNITQ